MGTEEESNGLGFNFYKGRDQDILGEKIIVIIIDAADAVSA